MRVAKFASFCAEVYRSAVDERLFLLGMLGSRALGSCFCGKLAPSWGIGAHIHVTEHRWVHTAMTLILLFWG